MAIDLNSKWWADHPEGTQLQTYGTDYGFDEIPLEVTLEWHSGGWKKIVGVRIGSEITNPLRRGFKEGISQPLNDFENPEAMQSQEISLDLIAKASKVVLEIQQDLEQTRAAVAMLRKMKKSESVAELQSRNLKGKLNRKHSAKHSDPQLERENLFRVTYGLKNLLKAEGIQDYAKMTADLLGIGVSTVHKYCKEAEKILKPSKATKKPRKEN